MSAFPWTDCPVSTGLGVRIQWNTHDTSILKEKSKNEIITKINSQLNISDIQRDFTEKEKKSLLIIGLKSCMADGKIAKSELNTIFDLARYLSINKTDVNQLIKKYRI